MKGPEQRVSLYATVLNEADSMDQLLDSLAAQTRQPDELIFVDGGSTDGTIDKITEYQATHPNVRLIRYPKSSPSEGRNKGFETAVFDLVASIDGGCRAKSDWLENLLKEAQPGIDIVSGVYLPDSKTRFESCLGDLTFPDVKSLPEDWSRPSHRSVLIRKRVWQSLGGYPPHLGPSEDTWFNHEAKQNGFRFKIARDAVVYWRPRRNLIEVFNSSFRWMMSDVKHNIDLERLPRRMFVHNFAEILSLFGWCVAFVTAIAISPPLGGIGLIVLTLLMIRPIRTIHLFRAEKSYRSKVTKNLIVLASSSAIVAGYLFGRFARAIRRPS